MDKEQARSFIKSNRHPKLWGYDPEAGKWTFSIRPWLSIRLHPQSVAPEEASITENWPPLRDPSGQPMVWEAAEFGFYERETLVLTCRLLRLPEVVIIPAPAQGTNGISLEDYQFARCLERNDGPAGGHLLERTLGYLGLTPGHPEA